MGPSTLPRQICIFLPAAAPKARSLVGRNAYLKGDAEIRYDEALGGLGHITGFKLVSWFEDTKQAGTFTDNSKFLSGRPATVSPAFQ